MPLIILCLIVVVCGLLLFYYQLGPKVSRRIGDGLSGFVSGLNPSGNAEQEGEQADDKSDGTVEDINKKADKDEKKDDDKVMFVYGGGEREERPLDTDEKSDK